MNDQRSLTDQMRDVARLADQHGHYDAADWIRQQWPQLRGNTPLTRENTDG